MSTSPCVYAAAAVWLADVEVRSALSRPSRPGDESYLGDQYAGWLEAARRLLKVCHRDPLPKVMPRLMTSDGLATRLEPVDACLSALRSWLVGQGAAAMVVERALASAPQVENVVQLVAHASGTPFVERTEVARGLRRRPTSAQLRAALPVASRAVAFPNVPFHNNSAGVRALLFERRWLQGVDAAWPLLAAEYVAEQLPRGEWDSIEDDERAALLEEDLLLGERAAWRPLSWFDAVSHLFDLRAGNGAPPDAAEKVELSELVQSFGRYEAGALCPSAYRAVLVFEKVVWSEHAIL